jgi:hypothetical protein
MTEKKLTKTEQKLADQLAIGNKPEVIQNRFGGGSIECEPLAAALYDYIMGCEAMRNYKGMQQGLTMFRKHWGEAYMVLLD